LRGFSKKVGAARRSGRKLQATQSPFGDAGKNHRRLRGGLSGWHRKILDFFEGLKNRGQVTPARFLRQARRCMINKSTSLAKRGNENQSHRQKAFEKHNQKARYKPSGVSGGHAMSFQVCLKNSTAL
jgi:hypothetical protein